MVRYLFCGAMLAAICCQDPVVDDDGYPDITTPEATEAPDAADPPAEPTAIPQMEIDLVLNPIGRWSLGNDIWVIDSGLMDSELWDGSRNLRATLADGSTCDMDFDFWDEPVTLGPGATDADELHQVRAELSGTTCPGGLTDDWRWYVNVQIWAVYGDEIWTCPAVTTPTDNTLIRTYSVSVLPSSGG